MNKSELWTLRVFILVLWMNILYIFLPQKDEIAASQLFRGVTLAVNFTLMLVVSLRLVLMGMDGIKHKKSLDENCTYLGFAVLMVVAAAILVSRLKYIL